MVDIQTIGVVVTAASVTVAAIYYMFTLRINVKTQQLALRTQQQNLETRQVQLLMQVFQNQFDKGFLKDFIDLLNIEWSDYDDFERRYGSDNNPDNYAVRMRLNNFFESIGFLVKNGFVGADKVYEVLGMGTIAYWNKFSEIYRVQREVYKNLLLWENMQYLYGEMNRISVQRSGYTGSGDKMKPYSYRPSGQASA